VIISRRERPPDVTIVLGVNEGDYDPESQVGIANASCTTTAFPPLAKVPREEMTIAEGSGRTITHVVHQRPAVIDLPH